MATNKVTTNVIDMSGNTGGLVWAKGTKAQRPAGSTGDLRLNTTDNRLEYKDNSDWKRFAEGAATPSVDFEADFLVVAGGGGAGGVNSGGGGAGGLRTSFGSTSGGGASNESKFGVSLSTSYTVTVGAGGAGVDGPPAYLTGDSQVALKKCFVQARALSCDPNWASIYATKRIRPPSEIAKQPICKYF